MLSPSKDIAHKERDQMLLEEGKRFLLEEWERGNGYVTAVGRLARWPQLRSF